ncbi:MAG: RMD1 family protein [bacterium]|nr:RMD1 family protein [bacterium]
MTRVMKVKHVKHSAETVYTGESIDLKKIQENVRQYAYLNRDHPLVVRLLKDQYAVLTKFGAVTFWDVPYRLRLEFLKEIQPFVKSKKGAYHYDEDTKVLVGGDTTKITFDKVFLPKLAVEEIKIISYVLSQSVALERYEDEIETSLSEIGTIVENLKSSGQAMLTEKQLLKQIGNALSVKQTAVAHLSLFDKPEEVWESPELENLYNRMNAEYELQDRFDVLDEKIKYLSDISQMLMNFLAEKRNAFLEKIIICLFIADLALWFLPPFPEVLRFIKGLF